MSQIHCESSSTQSETVVPWTTPGTVVPLDNSGFQQHEHNSARVKAGIDALLQEKYDLLKQKTEVLDELIQNVDKRIENIKL